MVAATKLPVGVVTPRQMADAKAKALELCAAAYAPQSIAQPDGSALELCWQGRIHRAFGLAEEARRAGDTARMEQIRAGIDQLSWQYGNAQTAAERAAADYAGLCASMGREPDDVYPAKCQCEGCVNADRQMAYLNADAELRHAVFRLMTPKDATDPLPHLVTLLDGAGDADTCDRLWYALKRIGDAQRAYSEACGAFGKAPDWHRVLCVYDD